MATRYHITLPDTERAHGAGEFAFRSQGAEGLAGELQDALRSDALFQRWRATQEDPDSVDPALGATDPAATVSGEMHNLRSELIVTTSIPGRSPWRNNSESATAPSIMASSCLAVCARTSTAGADATAFAEPIPSPNRQSPSRYFAFKTMLLSPIHGSAMTRHKIASSPDRHHRPSPS